MGLGVAVHRMGLVALQNAHQNLLALRAPKLRMLSLFSISLLLVAASL